MGKNRLAKEKVAQAAEKQAIDQVPPGLGHVGQVLAAPMPDMAINGCKEAPRLRPSKAERRARLIAAHVAVEAVRFELEGSWKDVTAVRTEIMAAIGRLEVMD